MLLDAAIGYIAQGLKAGDMKRQIRDLPTLIALRNQLSDVSVGGNKNTVVYESVRVKEAKDQGEDIIDAMYEDARELTAILGSLRHHGAEKAINAKSDQNSAEVLKLVGKDED
jgi:nitrate reductase beta subunit